MKTHSKRAGTRGFTLMELMVAMAITTIIVTVLVSITSIALDTWNRSRSELRASRQAKALLDAMGRDLESLVSRTGTTTEWLSARVPNVSSIGDQVKSTNAADLLFFTGATDRYDGNIGTTDDKGGDVSCVSYKMSYRDALERSGGTPGTGRDFRTFVINRYLVSPENTFKNLLGGTGTANASAGTDVSDAIMGGSNNTWLEDAFSGAGEDTEAEKPKYFMCENVFQFSMTFHMEVKKIVNPGASQTTLVYRFPISLPSQSGPSYDGISITGGGVVLRDGSSIPSGPFTFGTESFTRQEILSGRVTAVEISTTVLSDFGMDQLKRRTFTADQEVKFLKENSYQYSKLVQLPTI